MGVEHFVQDAFDSGLASWFLSHTYLAAQLVVLPLVSAGALPLGAEGLPAAARHGAGDVADLDPDLRGVPGRPAAAGRGMGFTDSVSASGAVNMTGRLIVFYNELAGRALACTAGSRWRSRSL